ncbi:MT-A70 family protein (modular protein) [Acidithiobacillus ferrivorans]|uniref:MT-A70 family protein (Modular protein) n=1 Tax=Acidithiobacillus ferrivorans TaxID=160808 RepID=A0A060UUV3_9PROT|nr:hypothetical protein [Acidithiobacillus ferrivorans]CDQ12101.1 MT-A70 family protein (modular protein) [Acidithiobacillus ferrivorans]SMH64771.1 MT-A70 family protein (modular protein) [Acidithiobacillus ferrivorans]
MSTPQKKIREPRTAFIERIRHVQVYIDITKSGWVPMGYRFPEWTGITGNFGAWAANVRASKSNGKLRPKHEEALDKLGFVWGREDVDKVLSRAQISPVAAGEPCDRAQGWRMNSEGQERKNSILRETNIRPEGYPEAVRDVGAAEDMALSFGLIYSDVITQYARSDTDEALARQNARPILDKLRGMDLGRITKDDATIVLWSPPSLFCEADALLHLWGFSLCHVGYWRKGVTPGHCHTLDPYDYYLVGKRGTPYWGLTKEYGRFLRGYIGNHIQQEDRLLKIFQTACEGPGLEIFGTAPRPGWTLLQEPERGDRRAINRSSYVANSSHVRQLATELF